MAQLASTPVGMEVRAVVRLGGVNDRRLTFIWDGVDWRLKGYHINSKALLSF